MKQPLGPRMYYSLFGIRGLALGAKAKILRMPVTITVEAPGIRHPVSLRVRTTDVALCREILLNGLYDCQFRRSPEVILDLGANIGLSTVFYANKFPDAKIIAVEPEPSNFAVLRKNSEPYRNVTIVHGAVWKAPGVVRLFDSGQGHTAFRVGDTIDDAELFGEVRAIPVEMLLQEQQIGRVDLLKMDVEGAESEIFAHSSGWIDRVGIIAVEIHDWLVPDCGRKIRAATRDFRFESQKGDVTYLTRTKDELSQDSANNTAATFGPHSLKIVSVS